ncbi:MAG: SDR family oxidoreductase [Azospirillaceae bacterium]
MKVLVTGHRGYIGSVLVPLFQAAGHEVRGLDSDLFARSTYGPASALPTVDEVRRDIRDVTIDDVRGVDAVVHLAGMANDPMGDLVPEVTMAVNHEATVRLAGLAKEAGIERFVFSSSCSVYGAATEEWVTETSRPNPVTPYGQSKLDAEHDLIALADDRFTPVFMRSATAYGFSPRIRFDLVINNLAAYAFTKGAVFIKSDGMPWRPVVHIEDIARAMLAAVEAPRDVVHGEAFNVGQTTENYRIHELASIVERTVPDSKVEYAPGNNPDKRTYRVDCTKIARTLHGFKPQWTAERGAQELYRHYKAIGLTESEFEGPRYQRLAHLKGLIASGDVDEAFRWQTAPEAATA